MSQDEVPKLAKGLDVARPVLRGEQAEEREFYATQNDTEPEAAAPYMGVNFLERGAHGKAILEG
jgi:hypothetical protein